MLKMAHGQNGVFKLTIPTAPTGKGTHQYVYEIIDVPDHITDNDVINIANTTIFLPAKYDGSGRYIYNFTEIGEGKIIHD